MPGSMLQWSCEVLLAMFCLYRIPDGQVTSSQDGAMGATFSSLLMGNASQSDEDGSMGILRGCCDPGAKTGDFFGPTGMTGPAVFLTVRGGLENSSSNLNCK